MHETDNALVSATVISSMYQHKSPLVRLSRPGLGQLWPELSVRCIEMERTEPGAPETRENAGED